MKKLSQKFWQVVSLRYLKQIKNPVIVLNRIYLHIAIVLMVLSLATSFSATNVGVSNKLFEWGAYSLGVIILNAIILAIYETLSKRKELLD